MKVNKIKNNLSELSERVNNIEKSIPNIKAIHQELNYLKSKIEHQENLNVSYNLRICGVPYTENENLFDLYSNLCNFLNMPQPNIKSIQRIRSKTDKKNKNSASDGVILVKFFSPQERNFVLRSIANYKRDCKTQLTLDILGKKSNTVFYVNEDLTNRNYKILQAAVKLKNKSIISAAFTMRGLVYVKTSHGSRAIRIDSLEKLDSNFFRPPDQSFIATNDFQSNNQTPAAENDVPNISNCVAIFP